MRSRFAVLGLAALAGPLGCGGKAGTDGTEILVPYGDLSGGVVFASQAIVASADYDLYWAPVPAFATVELQPVFRLTDANGSEWQPSVSAGGQGIVFARKDDGIFVITTSGRIKRISDTNGTNFKDSLPAISPDGVRVAWVREDTSKPIGQTGFTDAFIMIADVEAPDQAAPLDPRPGTVQDAPKFSPDPRATRVAWSEFSAQTLVATGPQDYGIYIHDYETRTGDYACRSPAIVVDGAAFRCFGQHLAWPVPETIVLPQTFLEVHLEGSPPTQVLGPLLATVSAQQLGQPYTEGPPGFFDAFPLSASYQNAERMIFDGVVTSVDGDRPTLAFFVAGVDGQAVWRLQLGGYSTDIDEFNTAGYFFSLATPQLVP